ncbi:MAG: hypothetical protein ACREXM_16870 [Gammaproteobacteria bacterium]
MGWLYYAATKKALIADRTTAWETDGVRGTTLAFCVRGNRLWKVVEVVSQGRHEREVHRSGRPGLSRPMGIQGSLRGRASLPLRLSARYLAQVPVECEKWREGVQAYHARIHRRVQIGQRIALSGARIPWVRIVSVRPLRGEYRGTVYRLPRALLGEVLPESLP